MFEISIGRSKKNQETRILLDIDRSPLAIPPTVLIGAGDRKARLKAHYAKCIGAGNDGKQQQALFGFFGRIFGYGKEENRGLHLVCNCKQHAFHAQVVKEFLIEHKDLLDMVSGYLVNSSKPVAQTTEDRPIKDILDEAAAGQAMMPFGGQGTSAQLPPDEMAQIQRLIEEDQARERLAQQPQAQEVSDNSQQITE